MKHLKYNLIVTHFNESLKFLGPDHIKNIIRSVEITGTYSSVDLPGGSKHDFSPYIEIVTQLAKMIGALFMAYEAFKKINRRKPTREELKNEVVKDQNGKMLGKVDIDRLVDDFLRNMN